MAQIIKKKITENFVSLTFNRKEKLNALSTEMLKELYAMLQKINNDKTIQGVILKGAGGKAFIAGADIGEYKDHKRNEFIQYSLRSREIFDFLENLSKVTIAAVDGYALGGGFEIALCCDYIVCTENSKFGLPEGKLGLSPGGGGTQKLIRMVSKQVASDILLSGSFISGIRAKELGLAVECVSPNNLDEVVKQRIERISRVSPLAQRQMKRLIREGFDSSLTTAKSFEQEVLFNLYSTYDGQEGISAFLDKRQPKFKGE